MKYKEQVTNDIILRIDKTKSYNAMIDWQNFFDQPVRNDLIRYDNIRKIATGQGDDHATSYLLDCNYFKNYYKMITKDLSKQQAPDADPKAIQQVTGNIEQQATMFSIFHFSQGTVKVF